MLKSFHINNYKSVKDLKLELGRVNVFIGENGSGKSNILEAFVLAGVTLADRPDQETMSLRGVRRVKSELVASAFPTDDKDQTISLSGDFGARKFELHIQPQPDGFTKKLPFSYHQSTTGGNVDFPSLIGKRHWPSLLNYLSELGEEESLFRKTTDDLSNQNSGDKAIELNRNAYLNAGKKINSALFGDFGIYAPNLDALANPASLSTLNPFDLNGYGLLAYWRDYVNMGRSSVLLQSVKEKLKVFGWFKEMNVVADFSHEKSPLEIQDRYLDVQKTIDHYSANEGFLFMLFYLTLMSIHDTPRFFAIDNIETALNPRLCTEVLKAVAELSEEMGKQVIITTHNPAVLDGLNLHDDDQRLFLIYRNNDGHTTAKRIYKPEPLPGRSATKLSQLFMEGKLGGLPDHF